MSNYPSIAIDILIENYLLWFISNNYFSLNNKIRIGWFYFVANIFFCFEEFNPTIRPIIITYRITSISYKIYIQQYGVKICGTAQHLRIQNLFNCEFCFKKIFFSWNPLFFTNSMNYWHWTLLYCIAYWITDWPKLRELQPQCWGKTKISNSLYFFFNQFSIFFNFIFLWKLKYFQEELSKIF